MTPAESPESATDTPTTSATDESAIQEIETILDMEYKRGDVVSKGEPVSLDVTSREYQLRVLRGNNLEILRFVEGDTSPYIKENIERFYPNFSTTDLLTIAHHTRRSLAAAIHRATIIKHPERTAREINPGCE